MNYPLATSSWDDREIDAINRVVETGRFTMGENVAQFEQQFASFVGSRYAVMVNSGSSANLLMIAALAFRSIRPFRPGDEVIVPAVSWPTTYYPVSQYGFKLKFVDIDVETLNFDLRALRDAVGSSTRAIFAVNLLGNPNDFGEIRRIIGDREILLLEDNCESLGAQNEGRYAGTFGVMGSFSTYFSHHMSTIEGGLIVTDDEELYHLLLCLRAHGWTRNLPKINKVTGTKSDDPFDESFRFVLPGYNVRPTELQGAIGSEQLAKFPSFLAERRKNAVIFVQQFAEHPHFRIQKEIGTSSWFGFSLVARSGQAFDRRALARKLSDNGIECRPIVAGNFAKNPVLKHMLHEIHGRLPNAEWIDSYGLFVGNHHYDIGNEIARLREITDSIP